MSNELAVREMSLADLRGTAELMAASGLFDTRDNQKIPLSMQVGELVTKILAGREYGFGPYASVTGIHVIKGKPTLSGNLLATMVKRSGKYNYRVVKMDDKECSLEFFESGKSVGISTFTTADAAKAGTQNMSKFPRNMLFNRAMSNGVRWYCPDVTNGSVTYVAEEMGLETDDNGDIIETTARIVDTTTGEIESEEADKATFGQMHALGREAFGDKWRNGAGRAFVKAVIDKETTKGILQHEAKIVITALQKVLADQEETRRVLEEEASDVDTY